MSVIRPGKESHQVLAMASNRTYGLNLDAGETMQPQPFSLVGDGAGSIFKIFTTAAALDMGMGINAQLDAPARFEAKGLGSGGAKGCPADTWCVLNDGQLPGADERHRCAGHLAEHRLREADLAGGRAAHAWTWRSSWACGRTPCPAPPATTTRESNESLADFVKRQNLGSFTLGPIELNALELSNVAATLASGGTWCPPSPIDKVVDRTGKEVSVTTETCEQVVPKGLANTLANALSKDDQERHRGGLGRFGGLEPADVRQDRNHRGAPLVGLPGLHQPYAAANYIYDDSRPRRTCAPSRCGNAGPGTCTAATSPRAPGSPR